MKRKVLDFISDFFSELEILGAIRQISLEMKMKRKNEKMWLVHEKTKTNFIVKDIVRLANPNIYNLI